jgi:hypothetical protein
MDAGEFYFLVFVYPLGRRLMTEQNVQDAIRNYVRENGGFVIKLHGNALQGKSTLDLLGGLRGVPFVCEVKRPGERPTKFQAYVLARCAQHGYTAIWADSLQMFKDKFSMMTGRIDDYA